VAHLSGFRNPGRHPKNQAGFSGQTHLKNKQKTEKKPPQI